MGKNHLAFLIFNGPRFLFSLLFFLSLNSFGQSGLDSVLGKLDPQRYASIVSAKTQKLEKKLAGKTEKVLKSLKREERKLYEKMLKGKDSLLAKAKLEEIKTRYASIKNPELVGRASHYIPQLDSLTTSLKFLHDGGISNKVSAALRSSNKLQTKFNYSEQVRNFIKERKEQLKQIFKETGVAKQLKKINKRVYYYSAQLQEYKAILKEPKKIEKKALELLSRTQMFKDFMRNNSFFARLFPGSNSTSQNLTQQGFAGLQTRAQLVTSVTNQYGNNMANSVMPALQQNILNANSYVNELRSKMSSFYSGEELDMPDFKPNNQKVKSFKNRIEFGTDLQTQRSNRFFPITSDLAVSAVRR